MLSIFMILVVVIFSFSFIFLKIGYLKILIPIEPALAQENKEVFNVVIENVLIIGIITAVAALMKISSAINQRTFSKLAYQNFEISMWVSFTGLSVLLIFSHHFY